jgi:hypothetical protein
VISTLWRRAWKTQKKKTKAKTVVMSRPGFGTSVVFVVACVSAITSLA